MTDCVKCAENYRLMMLQRGKKDDLITSCRNIIGLMLNSPKVEVNGEAFADLLVKAVERAEA